MEMCLWGEVLARLGCMWGLRGEYFFSVESAVAEDLNPRGKLKGEDNPWTCAALILPLPRQRRSLINLRAPTLNDMYIGPIGR